MSNAEYYVISIRYSRYLDFDQLYKMLKHNRMFNYVDAIDKLPSCEGFIKFEVRHEFGSDQLLTHRNSIFALFDNTDHVLLAKLSI